MAVRSALTTTTTLWLLAVLGCHDYTVCETDDDCPYTSTCIDALCKIRPEFQYCDYRDGDPGCPEGQYCSTEFAVCLDVDADASDADADASDADADRDAVSDTEADIGGDTAEGDLVASDAFDAAERETVDSIDAAETSDAGHDLGEGDPDTEQTDPDVADTDDLDVADAGDAEDLGPDESCVPAEIEICDGIDNTCNRQIDEGCDDDSDGWCRADVEGLSERTSALCPNGYGDCDDRVGFGEIIYPFAEEVCDGLDNQCADGRIDEGCDQDGDGWCRADTNGLDELVTDLCPLGYGDCEDRVGMGETVYPDAEELCDGVANDCGELVDEGCDADGDGWCRSDVEGLGDLTTELCLEGYGDCNDIDGEGEDIHPGAAELCDGIDNNCADGPDRLRIGEATILTDDEPVATPRAATNDSGRTCVAWAADGRLVTSDLTTTRGYDIDSDLGNAHLAVDGTSFFLALGLQNDTETAIHVGRLDSSCRLGACRA